MLEQTTTDEHIPQTHETPHNPTQPSQRQAKLDRDTVSSTECAQPPSISAIPLNSPLFRRYRRMSMKPSLPCVVQYPLGQVFVSSPG